MSHDEFDFNVSDLNLEDSEEELQTNQEEQKKEGTPPEKPPGGVFEPPSDIQTGKKDWKEKLLSRNSLVGIGVVGLALGWALWPVTPKDCVDGITQKLTDLCSNDKVSDKAQCLEDVKKVKIQTSSADGKECIVQTTTEVLEG